MKRNTVQPYIVLQTYALILLAMLIVTACKDDLAYKVPSIAGYYKVESLVADIEVDLNNDGIISTNAMEEIRQAHYNFSNPDTYLEIRPTKYNNTPYQHMYIPFPNPRLTFEYTNSPNGAVNFLRNELNGIGYGYEYKENDKVIHLNRTNVKEENENLWGKLVDIKVIGKDRLELLVSKNYYDFKTARWVRLQLIGTYVRVN